MKNFLKLLNFELGRFFKIYLVLIGLTIVSQLAGTVLIARGYMNDFQEMVHFEGYSIEQFLEQYWYMSPTNIINSGWFNLPILFAAAALIIYCFFIWYRDWLGKNTFIYRLLMLPTARINIYFSKAAAIFLMVLGLVALQVILLLLEGKIMQWMIPANLRIDYTIMGLIESTKGALHLGVIIPTSFIEFLIHYCLGFMVVFVLFTAILFERSYRLKGIIFGILYVSFSAIIFFSPFWLMAVMGEFFFYPIELFIVEVILWGVVTAMSILVSNHLLNKKITV